MEEQSIADLMSALQMTQQKSSVVRLNERNVVELINKLNQLGFLGDGLLHTVNGREYVTPEHLRKELVEAVEQAGGRMSLVDLPTALGMDMIHCEKQAKLAIEQSKGALQLIHGELIMQSYFDSLAAEIQETLQECGVVHMAALAQHFGLAGDLLQSVLEPRIGHSIQGRLQAGLLFTPAYISRIKAQLRGALRGCTVPIQVASLRKSLGMGGTAGPASQVITPIIDDLVAEGSIQGKLQGGGTSWIPAAHTRRQQEAVTSFYQQNGFVGYDMVTKLGVANAQQHLLGLFPDGIALQSAFVAPTQVQQLDAAIEEAVDSDSWVDCLPLVPSVLSTADTVDLLSKVPAAQQLEGKGSTAAPRGRLLSETCIVSTIFVASLQEKALAEACSAATEALKQRKASQAAASTSSEGGKESGQKTVAASAQDEAADSDEDWSRGSKASKGKKGGKAKKPAKAAVGKAAKPSSSQQGAAKAREGNSNAAVAMRLLSTEALTDKILEWAPEVEGAGADSGLPAALAAAIRPQAITEYEKALTAVFNAGAEARRRRREALAKVLQATFERLQLYAHGARFDAWDESTQQALQRHLVRGLGSEAVDQLLLYQQADVEEAAEQQQAEDAHHSMSPAERLALVQSLPAESKSANTKCVDALGGLDSEALILVLEEAAGEAGVRLKRLDRKDEKAALQAEQQALNKQLQTEQDPAAELSLAVPLLVQRVHSCAISIPGRALGGVIEGMKKALPEDVYSIVSRFHADVVSLLKAGGPGKAADVEERLKGVGPALRTAALEQGKFPEAAEESRAHKSSVG